MGAELGGRGGPGRPDLGVGAGVGEGQPTEGLGQDPGDGSDQCVVAGAGVLQAVGEPAPGGGLEDGVHADLVVDAGARLHHDAEVPVPGLLAVGVVEDDEASGGHGGGADCLHGLGAQGGGVGGQLLGGGHLLHEEPSGAGRVAKGQERFLESFGDATCLVLTRPTVDSHGCHASALPQWAHEATPLGGLHCVNEVPAFLNGCASAASGSPASGRPGKPPGGTGQRRAMSVCPGGRQDGSEPTGSQDRSTSLSSGAGRGLPERLVTMTMSS